MDLHTGDIIQLPNQGLFYVVQVNPALIMSISGGPKIPLNTTRYMKICSSILESEPPSIRKFIKECLSL